MWSFDGKPYRMVWVDGSCQSKRCEISLTGLPAFVPSLDNEDVCFVSLNEQTGIFSETHEPSLKGFPPDQVANLDGIARSLDTKNEFSALPLLRAEWVIPPPEGGFRLRYGKGNEEGDSTYLVTISGAERSIVRVEQLPSA